MALLEPPPQITVFNWVWIKWLSTLRDKLCAPEVVTVEDSDMTNGWVNYDADKKVKYWRGADGVVHLSGTIKDGLIGQDAFTIHYPPSLSTSYTYFPIVAALGIRIARISETGVITPIGDTNAWVSLDGITYKS